MKIKASMLSFEPFFYEGKTTYLCKICQNDWTMNEDGICNMCKENAIYNDKYLNKVENIEIIDDRHIHPCGDCANYGDEDCMEHMKECEYSDKEILKKNGGIIKCYLQKMN